MIIVLHSIVTNIFFFYSQLSLKLDKTIIVYYGVNGHGKGTLDAMSGFGVKSVVRRAIVTHDFFYSSAEDFFVFLKKEMAHKGYHCNVLPNELLERIRQNHKGIEI